jgi:hypothetical protein
MARLAIAAVLVLACFASASARAEGALSEKLSSEKLGEVQPGEYQADTVHFALNRDGSIYLLQFDGDPEVFVLYSDFTSLGGRVLKYDSGESALQITGWGGITLYTDARPGGLPAERSGDCDPPALQPVSLSDMQSAIGDESDHLAYTRRLNVKFDADWKALQNNDALRARAFDALENTARGIERYAAKPTARKVFSEHFNRVQIAVGAKPTLDAKDKTLVATFDPDTGYRGRASSRAIARALERLLHVK